jgi:hypothetical protein
VHELHREPGAVLIQIKGHRLGVGVGVAVGVGVGVAVGVAVRVGVSFGLGVVCGAVIEAAVCGDRASFAGGEAEQQEREGQGQGLHGASEGGSEWMWTL